jgi:dimethylamine monooxygenase subunit C
MNKSRPLYAPFKLDLSGRAHLIVTTELELPEILEFALADIETWTVKTIAPGIQAPIYKSTRAFRAVPELLGQLAHRLSRETAGFRLYAIGTESFMWDVHNLARAAGMGAAEIFMTRAGPFTRRVYCTHCRTMIEDVANTITPCPGCGAALFVRDHFSRRLAAFMGVKVDAEAPGEIPVPEAFSS